MKITGRDFVPARGLTQSEVAKLQGRQIGSVGKDFQKLRREGIIEPLFRIVEKDVRRFSRETGQAMKFPTGNENPYVLTEKAIRIRQISVITDRLDRLALEDIDSETFNLKKMKILGREIEVTIKTDLASKCSFAAWDAGWGPAAGQLAGLLYAKANTGNISALLDVTSEEWRELGVLSRTHRSYLDSREFYDEISGKPSHDLWTSFRIETAALHGHAKNCSGCGLTRPVSPSPFPYSRMIESPAVGMLLSEVHLDHRMT